MNAYISVLTHYAVFQGRAQRKEFWMFVLFDTIIGIILNIIDVIIMSNITGSINWLTIIYALALLIPSISVTVRRLHDTDHSGWWFFILLIPILGAILLFVFMILDSDSPENHYGENPKIANNN
jgi:uncharacterized membrane protein YhaH (DUF805 family)